MPRAVPMGKLIRPMKPSTRVSGRAQDSRCNKPHPAANPARALSRRSNPRAENSPRKKAEGGIGPGNLSRCANKVLATTSSTLAPTRFSAEAANQRTPRTCRWRATRPPAGATGPGETPMGLPQEGQNLLLACNSVPQRSQYIAHLPGPRRRHPDYRTGPETLFRPSHSIARARRACTSLDSDLEELPHAAEFLVAALK